MAQDKTIEAFKMYLPAGYQVSDTANDNIDFHVITPDGNVYFGTAFTLENVKALMRKDNTKHFWATDMIIVKDLNKFTLVKAITEIMRMGYLGDALSKIGTIGDIYQRYGSFDAIPTLQSVTRMITWFDRKNEELAGEISIDHIPLTALRRIFSPSTDDPLLYNPFDIDETKAKELSEFTELTFDHGAFTYQLDCFQA